MFTDKTPALNVTSSHPGAWLDLGSVINVPESEGVMPLGHCLPGPRAVRVIRRSLPWEWGWIGEVCRARPGWAAHPATGGASGEARGQRAVVRVSASQPWAGASPHPLPALLWPQLFLYQCRLFLPPVKATLIQYEIYIRSGEKVPSVLKFTEIIRKLLLGKSAYTSLHFHPQFTPQMWKFS